MRESVIETSSSLLATFLEKQRNLAAVQEQLLQTEERVSRLRLRVQAANMELEAAKNAVERGLQGMPQTEEESPEGELPLEGAEEAPLDLAQETVHANRWTASKPLSPSLSEVLRAMPHDGATSTRELRRQLPHLPDHVIRSRVNKAKGYDLVTAVGWGKYVLTELGRQVRQDPEGGCDA